MFFYQPVGKTFLLKKLKISIYLSVKIIYPHLFDQNSLTGFLEKGVEAMYEEHHILFLNLPHLCLWIIGEYTV